MIYFPLRYPKIIDETEVWFDGPTKVGFIIYAVVVPIITGMGAIFNILNMIIFSRPQMCGATYSYLIALSAADCVSCILLFLSGFARSVFWKYQAWQIYDIFCHLPIAGISSGMSNLFLVCAAFDRLVYLRNARPRCTPTYCTKRVARQMISIAMFLAILINMPYFFVYRLDEHGEIETTEFFESMYYDVHNWIRFILTGMFPGLFLIFANTVMIIVIRKWSKCVYLNTSATCNERTRAQEQRRLTITLVAVVFLFIVGEIPTYFASRQSAITLLFNGDITLTDSKGLEIFRLVATTLNACHIAFDIIIYATLNPAYLRQLFKFFQNNCGGKDRAIIEPTTAQRI